jgi:hypothetical protein
MQHKNKLVQSSSEKVGRIILKIINGVTIKIVYKFNHSAVIKICSFFFF